MDRYDVWHKYNQVKFYLSRYTPNPEECRILILKVTEEAMRDYLGYFNHPSGSKRELWDTASGFIFDDEYRFMWGDKEVSPETLLQNVDLEIEYLRRSAIKQFKGKHGT